MAIKNSETEKIVWKENNFSSYSSLSVGEAFLIFLFAYLSQTSVNTTRKNYHVAIAQLNVGVSNGVILRPPYKKSFPSSHVPEFLNVQVNEIFI